MDGNKFAPQATLTKQQAYNTTPIDLHFMGVVYYETLSSIAVWNARILLNPLHKPLDFGGEREEKNAEQNGCSANDPKVGHLSGRRIEFHNLRIDRLSCRTGQEP